MARPKTFLAKGGGPESLDREEAGRLFLEGLDAAIAEVGRVRSVLLLPPDLTRLHSEAGFFTCAAYRFLTERGIAVTVLPALGTHAPISAEGRMRMFPDIPAELFRVHRWERDILELGRLDAEEVAEITENALRSDWPVQVNLLLANGSFDLIVSLGQVVPHEVVGMANHAKNVLIGTGGREAIDKSHYAGALFGLERIMGRTDTPVRALLDRGMLLAEGKLPPVLYLLTVIGGARPELRGLYSGFGRECFELAATLSARLNIETVPRPLQKAVVYLDPGEFRSTWLGNKAIYRTRLAMADGGELTIIAGGLERFGEDAGLDRLIRRHGYCSAEEVRLKVAADLELAAGLSAAAHLVHGSADGRFTIRYCPGPGLTREEIESVGFDWGDISLALERYRPESLSPGPNRTTDGEEFFYIANPALGLWKA
ncbi:MAG: lactate racemase domain-containing protein [Treponema sp.]|nr:lactate racemase domain-containing protein [Treponema sp.]